MSLLIPKNFVGSHIALPKVTITDNGDGHGTFEISIEIKHGNGETVEVSFVQEEATITAATPDPNDDLYR